MRLVPKLPAAIVAFAFVFVATLSLPMVARAGGKVPCEPLMPKLVAAFKTSTANDADKAKATALQKTGLVKCKAEKDADAVVDFLAAFKLLGVAP